MGDIFLKVNSFSSFTFLETATTVSRYQNMSLPMNKENLKDHFARLWWDETVPTLVTCPYCHSQPILHPEQDRVLTIREYARLQGFPDFYRFHGTIKERYCQIGNAVAVPVARALGYTMGMAFQKRSGNEPLVILPPKFSLSTNIQLAKSLMSGIELNS
ncbi:hypothetical protein V6N11_058019 [Hibiscus sabdariffa]|uniref:DNA (cytosine-5-)-methyltransferase n=1 Tax=Hibiscus sabdariffa TaxID=183260 RepID=A0ABR1ZCI4_9ROSI